jgi:SpoVK/Ycf46/Vps4 family AAA+-type ATPase
MATTPIPPLPAWADEVRRRYQRGEATQFVLHGNVHDLVLRADGDKDDRLIPVRQFLFEEWLKKEKDIVARYNVAVGVQFLHGKKPPGTGDVELQKEPAKVLPILQTPLLTQNRMALIMDYAETIAPAAETSFSTIDDRAVIVTLQGWSQNAIIAKNQNIIILMVENLSELHPKLVANPRVATVRVPMPDKEERARLVRHLDPAMPAAEVDRMAEVTAGLKLTQIQGILAPAAPGDSEHSRRLKQIMSLLTPEERARLWGPSGQPPASDDDGKEEVLRLIAARKREIIERECYGLIEFVEPKHGFDVVGGLEEVKKDLLLIARNIREGRRSRVPMGLLFTGPMGTGKTFVAEAFAKESGLTAIKLKNFRSKWVGATEANLERILQVVQAIGQVMVIIDEGDRAFGNQGEDDGGTGSRVIGRIKEFMSDTANRGRVLFVLMTNRPDRLDIDIKRAGRLDRKIPFLYPQSLEELETIVQAQLRKNRVLSELRFPEHREELQPILGYSNADIEAIVLMAADHAAHRGGAEAGGEVPVTVEDLRRAVHDYLPSRDVEMLEYMELLAVFEASSRRMLPKKYAEMPLDQLQARLHELKLLAGGRR